MKQLTLTAVLLPLSVGVATGANASISMTDERTLFNNEAHGFEGKVKLACQNKADEITNTISEIVSAASSDSPISLLISSLKFVHIGTPFINECGSYMNEEEKEILTALVNFANSFTEGDSDFMGEDSDG